MKEPSVVDFFPTWDTTPPSSPIVAYKCKPKSLVITQTNLTQRGSGYPSGFLLTISFMSCNWGSTTFSGSLCWKYQKSHDPHNRRAAYSPSDWVLHVSRVHSRNKRDIKRASRSSRWCMLKKTARKIVVPLKMRARNHSQMRWELIKHLTSSAEIRENTTHSFHPLKKSFWRKSAKLDKTNLRDFIMHTINQSVTNVTYTVFMFNNFRFPGNTQR